jgi:hypothetical protein
MAAIGKLGAEALVNELIATHGNPELLAGALVANGVYELFRRLFPDHPAASVPARSRRVPDNIFGASIGGARGEPIALRSRAKRGEPTPEQQEQAAARLGQAAAAASGPQSAEEEPEMKDVTIDITPEVERLPRPIRRPGASAVKKAVAVAGATGGAAAITLLGGAATGGGGAPSSPVAVTGPTVAAPGTAVTAPAPPTTTQKVTSPGMLPGFAPGAPIGATPLAELMRQGAQVPGKTSPYFSGTWVPPKRRAYTRELWYKIATANAAKLLTA